MKRFLALILAAMMLLGGSAMAEEDNMTEAHVGGQTEFVKEEDKTSASQSTDVWLQVAASGTIDVTVPLVVVFKTNIDGGTASTGTSYKIINNSSAAIKVTEVKVTDAKTDITQNGVASNLKAVETLTEGNYDEYTLTMLPEDRYETKAWESARSVVDADGDGISTFQQEGNTGAYKIASSTGAEKKGLWRIEKKDGSEGGKDESHIKLTLATSKLSFVTKQKSNNDAGVENGVKLFNVAYIVKIDDSTAVGGDIKDETVDHAYSYDGN